jgi:hypothetical protein
LIEQPPKAEFRFALAKGKGWDAVRILRRVGVNLAIVVVAFTALPFVLQMTLGEEGVQKMKAEVAYILQGTPCEQVAEVFLHRQKPDIQ